MECLGINEIVKACRGTPCNIDTSIDISCINTDTRNIKKGELFIPLIGERFDGHDYINEAYEKGAYVVLSEKNLNSKDKPYIIVENTLKALHEIARYYKNKFSLSIVAITGSSGKTTTKDMVASVLAEKYEVLKTEGNLNNAIGLPLTLFRLNKKHQVAVLEMGMNSLGEIKTLAELVRPDIGIITNVGTAHIEKLKTRDNILKAKKELFTYFNTKNIAIINGDNDMLNKIPKEAYRIQRFGIKIDNNLRAYDVREDKENEIGFKTDIGNKTYEVIIPMPGIHNVYNALSAIAVGLELEMEMDEILAGIYKFKSSKHRMEIFTNGDNIRIINDAYNANPESMRAAIDVLKTYSRSSRTICILGDMFELGEKSKRLHRLLGEYITKAGIRKIITIGKHAKYIAKGAKNNGFSKKNIFTYESNSQALKHIRKIIKPKDSILIKGSRGMRMEEIVEFLRERG